MGIPHRSGQPTPPYIHAKPPLLQLQPISPRPTTAAPTTKPVPFLLPAPLGTEGRFWTQPMAQPAPGAVKARRRPPEPRASRPAAPPHGYPPAAPAPSATSSRRAARGSAASRRSTAAGRRDRERRGSYCRTATWRGERKGPVLTAEARQGSPAPPAAAASPALGRPLRRSRPSSTAHGRHGRPRPGKGKRSRAAASGAGRRSVGPEPPRGLRGWGWGEDGGVGTQPGLL